LSWSRGVSNKTCASAWSGSIDILQRSEKQAKAEPINTRERLDVTVGGQTFGLAAKDLVSILILLLACVAGYLLWLSQDARLQAIAHQHVYLYQYLQAQHALILEHRETLREWLETVSYNSGHPHEQHLPLTHRPSQVKPPPPPSSLTRPPAMAPP
jgi:hypothetical protein